MWKCFKFFTRYSGEKPTQLWADHWFLNLSFGCSVDGSGVPHVLITGVLWGLVQESGSVQVAAIFGACP